MVVYFPIMVCDEAVYASVPLPVRMFSLPLSSERMKMVQGEE